ncbi:MAG TPA: folate-binding protein [Casimicrobiaceae bacterium]|nr:folate-binding protein [Casimicrobiaceae bacterium]
MTSWTEFLVRRGATFDGNAVSRFSAPEEELAAARDAAVLCDLAPLASMRVAGPDAAGFLQGQFTSDVAALATGTAQYSAWCSPKGRMLANFLLLRIEETTFELLLPASIIDAVRKRLKMFVLRSKVTLEDTSDASVRIGVGGPASAAALKAALIDVPAPFQGRTLDGGLIVAVPGRRFIALMSPGSAEPFWDRISGAARPAGFPVWQWLAIRAGIPIVTEATTDRLIPQMANWDALDGVSFRKGCYTGQEIVARTQYLGRLKERTFLAHVDAPPPGPGEKLYSAAFGEQSCGMVLNAAVAPGGGSDLVAALQVAAARSGDVRIGSPDGAAIAFLPLPYPLPDGSPSSTAGADTARDRTA